jgi:predicted enzyme related to lactoylglutathione lyase
LLFDGTPRAGVLPTPLKGLPSTWTSYVRVADVRAITAQVQALGGRVLVDARERKVGGEAALIAGPSGAVIALQTWTPRQDARAADTHPATPRVAEANANEGGDP